jgi:hypothetical protein
MWIDRHRAATVDVQEGGDRFVYYEIREGVNKPYGRTGSVPLFFGQPRLNELGHGGRP